MVPMIHAQSSAKQFGGKAEDYIDIHELMDSTKAAFPDNRHRAITHNIWFCVNIIPKIFGHMRINSSGKQYSTKDVAERHILEDFRMKFIPSIQDYLENMEMKMWMQNGLGTPSSAAKLYVKKEDKPEEPVEIKKPSLTEQLDEMIKKAKPTERAEEDFHMENAVMDGFGSGVGFDNVVLDGNMVGFEGIDLNVKPKTNNRKKRPGGKGNSTYKD
jgi:hypothetical protein